MRVFLVFFLFCMVAYEVDGQKTKQSFDSFTIRDSMLYVIQKSPKVSNSFKQTSQGLQTQMMKTAPKSYIFNDTLLYFTREFEAGVLAGKAKGIFDGDIVRQAKKKYPGKSKKAVVQRLKMYSKKE